MSYIALEKLVKKPETSIYKLTLVAAARANELALNGQPLIKTHSKKVSTIALEEIAAGKVRYEETKSKGSKKSSS
jgi:DNA-directed RNA polymerase subunit omega